MDAPTVSHYWCLERQDGELIHECTPDEPQGRGILPYLQQPDIARLHLIPAQAGQPPLVLPFTRAQDPSWRPIFFRRHYLTLDAATGAEIGRSHLTVCGWQRTVAGRNVKSFTVLYPDGSLLVTDDEQAFAVDRA